MNLSARQREILGLDESQLVPVGRHCLLATVAEAYERLAATAREAGFDLQIASAYRSFQRQLLIWNGKLTGQRPVYDDQDCPVSFEGLTPLACAERVLRFSALPGASRHHWGTDIDVFDAAAVPADYPLQLNLAEVSPTGPFAALHAWLDEQIAQGQSFGFYRPYDRDRGGVAPERWHLSYAPLAVACAAELDAATLSTAWRAEVGGEELVHRELLEANLEALLERYVERVGAAPPGAIRYAAPA